MGNTVGCLPHILGATKGGADLKSHLSLNLSLITGLALTLCVLNASCSGGADAGLTAIDPAPGSAAAHRQSAVNGPGDYLPGGDSVDPGQDGLDPGAVWISTHQPLDPGHNDLDPQRYQYHSESSQREDLFAGYADDGMGGQTPLYKPGMWIAAEPGKLGYVTYGLRSLDTGYYISSLSLQLGGIYLQDENPDEYWVGVSNRPDSRWRWFGPFALGDLQELDLSGCELMNSDEQFGYITIAAYDGDALGIIGLSVETSPLL